MKQIPWSELIKEQSKNLVWVINLDLELVYANKSYLKRCQAVNGVEVQLNENVLLHCLDKADAKTWQSYYQRAMNGEYVEIEECSNLSEPNNRLHSQITFEPLTDASHKIIGVSCQSQDITNAVKQRSEADQMINASPDVYITDKIEEKHKLKLFESVITHTTDAVLITEAEPFDEPGPRILFVNEAFTKMTGYTAAEVIGKTPRILQGPNSDKAELTKLGRALRKWESCEISIINYKKSGEQFWIKFTVTPVANENGLYTHWISIEHDVTEQKIKELENEILVQISENFNTNYDYTVAANQVCLSIVKFGKFDWVEILIVNAEKTELQLFSHCVADPKDEVFYECSTHMNAFKISESLAAKLLAVRKQILIDDLDNNKEFARIKEAKKIGLNAVLVIPLTFNDKVVGVLNIGTKQGAQYFKNYSNIFHRLETFIGSELHRKKLENDLTHLFDAIPEILCITDINGKFLKINKAGCELLGYTEAEILNHNFNEFVHPADNDAALQEFEHLKKGKINYEFENRYLTKNGKIIWLNWYCNSNTTEGLIYATAKNTTEEKALRELNRKANALAKFGSWELDVVNQRIFWSDEVHQMHETDPKTFIPTLEAGINFYREDFQTLVRLSIEKSISLGEPFDFDAVLVTAKKNEIWVRTIGKAEFANGECLRIFGSFQDINVIKESEGRLLSLSKNLPGIVYQYLIKPDGTDAIKYASGNIEQIWGYTAEEVMANSDLVWNRIKAGGDFEKVKASIVNSYQNKSRWTCRFKYVLPTGELLTHLGLGTPIFLSDGTILYNSITLDITQEVKNEALLLQTTEIARIGSWELDLINKNSDSMYWSPMVKEILGVNINYNPTLTYGAEFFFKESKQKAREAFTNLKNDGVEFDIELVLASDTDKCLRCIGKSEMANNRRTKIYGSFQDISQQKQMTLQLSNLNKSLQKHTLELERTNEELEQFAFVASHDLQEPLRMISSFMAQLERKYGGQLDERAKKYIHFATDGAKRMKRIILDLLEYSKSNKTTDAKEEVDLNEVFLEYQFLRSKLIFEKNAQFIAGNLPKLKTYKVAVTQILHCLLDNAIRYSKESIKPIVELNAEEHETEWVFSIKDNGMGIDAQFYDKIFIMFQRLHNREEYSGSGIGLSIAKRHVEFLGGNIWVESLPGEGSTFYFTINKHK